MVGDAVFLIATALVPEPETSLRKFTSPRATEFFYFRAVAIMKIYYLKRLLIVS